MGRSPWEDPEFARLGLRNIDERFLPGTPQEVEFLIEEMSVRPGDRLLDLGCGAGRHCIEFARRGFQMTGLDVSEPMLAEAEKRAAEAGVDVSFRRVDLGALGEAFAGTDLRFHGAFCLCESGLGVLGGAQQDIRFLRAVRRLLLPERKLVITCLNGLRQYLRSRDSNPRFDYVSGTLHWEAPVGARGVLAEDQRLYTPSELTLMLEVAGYRDISVYGTSPGSFGHRELGIEDIEMMVVATRT